MSLRFLTACCGLFAAISLSGCGTFKPAAPPPLLHDVKQINADGSTTTIPEKKLPPFQRFARSRLLLPPGTQELFTLEVDLPPGEGDEGAYMAIYRSAKGAELAYFEQHSHQPRTDRYFHRPLTAAEWSEFSDFLKAHPMESLRVVHPVIAVDATAGNDSAANTPADETQADSPNIIFRFTRAAQKDARSVLITAPTPEDHPAIDLILLFSRFRDAAPLTCVYLEPIPPTTVILFADPQHKVTRFWWKGDDLRAVIVPPLPGDSRVPIPATMPVAPPEAPSAELTPPENAAEPPPSDLWYAYHDNLWVPSPPPPPPETEPATQPAPAAQTQPASTLPAAATAPTSQPAATAPSILESRFLTSGQFPTSETWSVETADHYTTVWHYLPIDLAHGQWNGFVVPNLVFDNDNFSIDRSRKLLYFIADGQFFSLPIPDIALTVKK